MKRFFSVAAAVAWLFCWAAGEVSAEGAAAAPRVRLETSSGPITLELNPAAAPRTVENFLRYVRDGFYDGTVFHRVIKGFMIQGGGLTPSLQRKAAAPPVVNEADNGLPNRRGTVAMARTRAPHSATSQFFINTADNPFLDHRTKDPDGWGYCVFGRVTAGMDVVDRIEGLPTHTAAGRRDVPVEAVVIRRAAVVLSPEPDPETAPPKKD